MSRHYRGKPKRLKGSAVKGVLKVQRVRVWVEGTRSATLLLTDTRERSLSIVIGVKEANSLKPWLEDRGSLESPDLYSALIRGLDAFGVWVRGLTVSKLENHTFHGILSLESEARRLEVDCRPSDGINLAARAQAPVRVAAEVVKACVLKSKSGKPLLPPAAWRRVQKEHEDEARGYREALVGHVIQRAYECLQEKTGGDKAREELLRAAGFPSREGKPAGTAPWDPEILPKWIEGCRGTEAEDLAVAFTGAIFLFSDAKRAIPYLEAAHQEEPEDSEIAFDLASAYALGGRSKKALKMLKEWKFKEAGRFGNFRALWKNPRFRELAGRPGGKHRDLLGSLQLRFLISTTPRRLGESPIQEKEYEATLPKPTKELLHTLGRILDEGIPLPLESIKGPKFEKQKKAKLHLRLSSGREVALTLGEVEASMIGLLMAGVQLPRPLTHDLFHSALETIRARIECVVLTRRRRWGIEAAVLLKRERQRELISLKVGEALTIALRAGCAVLIAESLTMKLKPRRHPARST